MNNFLLFAANNDPATWMVCLIGVGVVFVGLAVLIGIIAAMNAICDILAKKKTVAPSAPVQSAPVAVANAPIENRSEIVAAVCAAVAEENGTDISAIRVVSFKKL